MTNILMIMFPYEKVFMCIYMYLWDFQEMLLFKDMAVFFLIISFGVLLWKE